MDPRGGQKFPYVVPTQAPQHCPLPDSPMFGRRQWPCQGRNVVLTLGQSWVRQISGPPSHLLSPFLGCPAVPSQSPGFPACERGDEVLAGSLCEPRHGRCPGPGAPGPFSPVSQCLRAPSTRCFAASLL